MYSTGLKAVRKLASLLLNYSSNDVHIVMTRTMQCLRTEPKMWCGRMALESAEAQGSTNLAKDIKAILSSHCSFYKKTK